VNFSIVYFIPRKTITITTGHYVPNAHMCPSNLRYLGEGLFVWDDEIAVETAVACAEGVEVQRLRVPAARVVSFLALTCDKRRLAGTNLLQGIMDTQGRATERYAKLIDAYYSFLGSNEN
jgi:hypothetical protein